MGLIARFWPSSIDSLPEERGLEAGPAPTLFRGTDGKKLQVALFKDSYVQLIHNMSTDKLMIDDSSSGSSIEFGARQCLCFYLSLLRDSQH